MMKKVLLILLYLLYSNFYSVAEATPQDTKRRPNEYAIIKDRYPVEYVRYYYVLHKLQENNIDLIDRNQAVLKLIVNTTRQYGEYLGIPTIIKALKDKNVKKLTDKEIIIAIQDYKLNHYKQDFPSLKDQWHELVNTLKKEKEVALDVLRSAEIDLMHQKDPLYHTYKTNELGLADACVRELEEFYTVDVMECYGEEVERIENRIKNTIDTLAKESINLKEYDADTSKVFNKDFYDQQTAAISNKCWAEYTIYDGTLYKIDGISCYIDGLLSLEKYINEFGSNL